MLSAVAIGACGSSDDSGSSDASTTSSSGAATTAASTGNAALTEAKAAVTKGLAAPTSIGIDKPLSKKPPTGKNIIFLRCSQPVCGGFLDGLKPATAALGWNLKSVSFKPTPEATVSAIQNAVRAKPDGIFYTGLDRNTVEPALQEAKKAGIPIVNGYEVDGAVDPIIANIADANANTNGPTLIADWIAQDSSCKGSVANFTIKSYPILVATTKIFQAEMKRVCPDMKVTEVDVQATDVGTKVPAAVVSALQSSPDTKYVAVSFGDMLLGVPAALKAAGLSPKTMGYGAASPNNVQNVAAGTETVESGYGIPYASWRAMDAFARKFVGDDPGIDTTAPSPGQIFTKENAGSVKDWNFAQAPDMADQFKKLWLLG